jgi:YbgC/YbaW family acyl-CoA thioester hydrolase
VTKQSEFRMTRTVQFHETDAAGIVHFSCFFRYMEEAEHAFWRSVGLSVAQPDSPYGWPRVAVSCDYRHPLRFEDEVEIHLRIVAMTERSLKYDCRMSLGSTVVANLSMTTVCVTRSGPGKTMKAAALPAALRDRFEVAERVGS